MGQKIIIMSETRLAISKVVILSILCSACTARFELKSFIERSGEFLSKQIREAPDSTICDKALPSGRRLLEENFSHLAGVSITGSLIASAQSEIVAAFGKKPICYLVWSKSVKDSTTESKYYIYETPGFKFTSYVIKSSLATSTSPSKIVSKNSMDVNNIEEAISALGLAVVFVPKLKPVWTLQDVSLANCNNLKGNLTKAPAGISTINGILIYYSTLTEEEGSRETVVVFRYKELYTSYRLKDNSNGVYTLIGTFPDSASLAAAVTKAGIEYDPSYLEPYKLTYTPAKAATIGGKYQVAFVIDTTGSMAAYLEASKAAIRSLVEKFTAISSSTVLEFGVVDYKDHPNQGSAYVTKVQQFTDSRTVLNHISTLTAVGGGDGPEAVLDGIDDAINKLSWKSDFIKYMFHIADYYPHGPRYERSDPTLKDSCPCGKTLENVSKALNDKEIKYYMYKTSAYADPMDTVFRQFIKIYQSYRLTGPQDINLKITEVLVEDLKNAETRCDWINNLK